MKEGAQSSLLYGTNSTILITQITLIKFSEKTEINDTYTTI